MLDRLLDVMSTWNVIRATGITAYVLLFLAVFAGVVVRLGLSLNKWKAPIHLIHQHAGWLAFVFGLIHGIMLLFDAYLPYQAYEVLIPFAAHYEPLLSGLGTIAFYLVIIVLVSSDIMQRLGKKVWRVMHFATFPAFFIALFHGVFLGTSSQQGWAFILYVVSGCIVVSLIFVRITRSEASYNRDDRNERMELIK